jgi:protein tyrosine/serine phosphatase
MASRIKRMKRAVRRGGMSVRAAVASATPAPLRRAVAPAVRFADMLLLDHLFARILFPNRHRLGVKAWRSAQPLPYQLKVLKKLGVRTVVNLRGNTGTTTYRLERAGCQRLGLAYVDCRLRSRDAPSRQELHQLRQVLERAEAPILLHCKSGADRAGLASALYLHIVEGVSIEDARHQLSWRYGHVRQADTGILDAFFELYLEHAARQPIDFFDWVDHHYQPHDLRQSYRAKGWANRLVDGILRRE